MKKRQRMKIYKRVSNAFTGGKRYGLPRWKLYRAYYRHWGLHIMHVWDRLGKSAT